MQCCFVFAIGILIFFKRYINLILDLALMLTRWLKFSVLFFEFILRRMFLENCTNNLFKLDFNSYVFKHIFYKLVSSQRYILISIFSNKIFFYIKEFIYNFEKDENKSLIKKLDLTFDLLILGIYNDVKNIRPWIFFILAYCIFIFLGDKGHLWICLSDFLFLLGVFIELIIKTNLWINNHKFKYDFPLLYYVIKYLLFGLVIIFILYKLIVVGQVLWTLIKTSVLKKLKSLKLSFDYQRLKNNKSPRDPGDPNMNIFEERRKKKERKETALELKEKVLKAQVKLLDANANTSSNQISFSEKKNWKGTVQIGEAPEFSVSDQLKNIDKEYQAYNAQDKKFKKIVVDISKGKEEFFPNESKFLFNEYVDVVKILKNNLKSVKKNLKK